MLGKLGLVALCFLIGLGGTLWHGSATVHADAAGSAARHPVPKAKPRAGQRAKATPTALDAAHAVCFLAARTRYKPGCEVDGFESRIDLTMRLDRTEAGKVCRGMADIVADKTKLFRGLGWKIRVLAPRSGSAAPLAACGIP